MGEVGGVSADRADQRHPQGQGGGEQDADGGVFFQLSLPGEKPDPQSHDHRSDQPTQQQVAVHQVGDGAQGHVAADYRAQDAYHQGGQQAALHESVGDGVSQPMEHAYPSSSALQQSSTTTAPFSSTSTCPPKASERVWVVSTSVGDPKATTRRWSSSTRSKCFAARL